MPQISSCGFANTIFVNGVVMYRWNKSEPTESSTEHNTTRVRHLSEHYCVATGTKKTHPAIKNIRSHQHCERPNSMQNACYHSALIHFPPSSTICTSNESQTAHFEGLKKTVLVMQVILSLSVVLTSARTAYFPGG